MILVTVSEDHQDDFEVCRASLRITRMTLKSVGRVCGPSGDCDSSGSV